MLNLAILSSDFITRIYDAIVEALMIALPVEVLAEPVAVADDALTVYTDDLASVAGFEETDPSGKEYHRDIIFSVYLPGGQV